MLPDFQAAMKKRAFENEEFTVYSLQMQINLDDWEATIQQIVDESKHELTRAGKHKLLMSWRAKLEEEPISLQPFQIDDIVREVRKRLSP